jgi:hypothetical protein
MIKSETITKLAPALLKAQQEMGNATKDTQNPYFRSKYADLNSVREAATPALHANGITLLQLTTHVNNFDQRPVPVVQTMLLHESGEYICSNTEIIAKEANNPQAYGSAISYARRYGLQAMLSIGVEDDDGNLAASTTTKKTEAAVTNGASKPTNSFGSFRKTTTNVTTT